MLSAPLGWWRKLLECGDANVRRALIESSAKQRLKRSHPLTAKQEQKLSRDIWELAWSIAAIEQPLSALAELEVGLLRIARDAEIELIPREAELERFLASGEADEERRTSDRRLAEEKLFRWLSSEEEPAAGERVDLFAVFCALTSGEGVPALAFEVRLSIDGGPALPQSPEQIAALYQDVRAKRKAASPQTKKLLEWALSKGSMPSQTGTAIPARNVTDWVALFGRDRLIRWEDGSAVEIELHPARLSLTREGEGPARWTLLPGDLPLSSAVVFREIEGASGEPQLWAKIDGSLRPLDALGMPADVFAHVLRAPEVPVEKLRDSALGALLARRIVQEGEPASASDLLGTIPVRPYIELRLENEMSFCVRARASSESGREFVRTHSGAWVPAKDASPTSGLEPIEVDGKAAAESGVKAERAPLPRATSNAVAVIPRAEDVAKVDAWLSRLVPKEAERTTGTDGLPAFSWRADGAATLKLVRLWLARPSGVDYLGDGSFRNVVKIQEAPELKIATREADAGIDWLEVSVELEDELAALSLSDIADALEQSDQEILMLRGARLYRREHLKRYLEEAEALFDLGIAPKSGWQKVHAKALAGQPERVLAKVKTADGRVRSVIERQARSESGPRMIPDAPIDPSALSFLRPYQRSGANFLTYASHTYGGALLADDMGLGKTLQTLSSITALRNLSAEKALPSLVICPASVAHNWKREAHKFVPDLKVVVIEGGEKRRQILDRLEEYDLVIENFALVRRDVQALAKQEFLAIAVDEAQAIKNPGADITQAVKQLRARHRIALTGTPIENRLTDLWSIADFAVPGYLGSLPSFERMVKDQEAEVLHKMLRARLRPLILRRLKRDVTPELPERIEERLDCEMTEGQKNVYLAEVKRTRLLLEGLTDPSAMTGEKRVRMLAALTRLRQICCEPALVDLPGRSSGKVDELMQLLPELLESGHKVLLFSQFVRMLELLETRLSERGIPFRTLTGQTVDRMGVVDAFEKDPTPSVFLISLKAGGTGLNLTSASHVVLFDPWWSPALEAQAIDRSHRIGQHKTVVAIRLVSKGTIEERILLLQDRKRSLSRDILEADGLDRSLGVDDFDFLLRWEEGGAG